MASSVVSALFGSYDLRNAKQWRDEDILHREQEIQWLNDDVVRAHEWRNADIERYLRKEKLENEHLVCAARADQLATISEQCTLLCGFTVASMVNLNFPEELSRFVLALYAVSASIVCVSLLLCTLLSSMLLLAVTRYASSQLELDIKRMDLSELEIHAPFTVWWLKKCDVEHRTAMKLMLIGVTLFFQYLGTLAWVQFIHYRAASITISSLSGIGFLFWQVRVASRWRYLLTPPASSSTFKSTSYLRDCNGYSSVRSSIYSGRLPSTIPFTKKFWGPMQSPATNAEPLKSVSSSSRHKNKAVCKASVYEELKSPNHDRI
ncbi:unnamed protein product [Albugo candida]|uniref:Uncharacterized protein n=1 Tax=Albugo candida TaxID=65357 RepID=A0A024GGW2_9STRA|nr:unnamed protein product [Albugo candida]|eukprot:CCI45775.1 unnamed protein product [Albugo candida]